jgi:signal transduction histidine kinase
MDPMTLIENTLESLHLPENIRLVTARDYTGGMIGDPGQIRQILWNLLTNAVEACGEAPAEIAIRVKQAGRYACIEVEDNGGGIAPEIKDKLMEQGISTKPSGLGLGLYLSRRLAEANGGSLDYESEPGRSTRFRLQLPAAPG